MICIVNCLLFIRPRNMDFSHVLQWKQPWFQYWPFQLRCMFSDQPNTRTWHPSNMPTNPWCPMWKITNRFVSSACGSICTCLFYTQVLQIRRSFTDCEGACDKRSDLDIFVKHDIRARISCWLKALIGRFLVDRTKCNLNLSRYWAISWSLTITCTK